MVVMVGGDGDGGGGMIFCAGGKPKSKFRHTFCRRKSGKVKTIFVAKREMPG
jgi:hypothetical protein